MTNGKRKVVITMTRDNASPYYTHRSKGYVEMRQQQAAAFKKQKRMKKMLPTELAARKDELRKRLTSV